MDDGLEGEGGAEGEARGLEGAVDCRAGERVVRGGVTDKDVPTGGGVDSEEVEGIVPDAFVDLGGRAEGERGEGAKRRGRGKKL